MVRIITKIRRNVTWYTLPALTTILMIGVYVYSTIPRESNLRESNSNNNNRVRLDLEEAEVNRPDGFVEGARDSVLPDGYKDPHKYDADFDTGEKAESSEVVKEVVPDWTCSKQIAILTPSMGPFKAWREYTLLQEQFLANADLEGVPRFHLSCPAQRCNLTVGATLKDEKFLKESEGVVINIAPSLLKNKLEKTVKDVNPKLRDDVSWFFLGLESPQMFTYWDAQIGNISTHYHITYHSESTVPVPYGFFVPSEPMDVEPRDFSVGKTHLVAWMASNCDNTFWPRIDFVHDLQNHLHIDMYGKCGNLTCLPPMSPECNNMLSKYKFYLALENTECDEYVTEKVWSNCLNHHVVPVVYGGRRAAYERLAPPHAFIHVGDFGSAEKLAAYLLELDKDDEKYNEYFKWRLKGHVNTNYPPFHPEAFCGTIPYLGSSETKPTKRHVSESNYFGTCREKPSGVFAKQGDYDNWSPWN